MQEFQWPNPKTSLDEVVLICVQCVDWFEEHIPECDIVGIVMGKEQDEEFAKEIDACWDEVANGEDETPSRSKVLMDVNSEITSGMFVEESFEVMTFSEVVERYKHRQRAFAFAHSSGSTRRTNQLRIIGKTARARPCA